MNWDHIFKWQLLQGSPDRFYAADQPDGLGSQYGPDPLAQRNCELVANASLPGYMTACAAGRRELGPNQ